MEQKINQAPYLLFERFKFMVLPHLNYSIDGLPGSRCLFITDDESFIISFEENMGCMDLLEYGESSHLSIVSEFHYKKKYLHQLRTDTTARKGFGNFAFFHMELYDSNGNIHILPGQMTANSCYSWDKGVEPILKKLLTCIAVYTD